MAKKKKKKSAKPAEVEETTADVEEEDLEEVDLDELAEDVDDEDDEDSDEEDSDEEEDEEEEDRPAKKKKAKRKKKESDVIGTADLAEALSTEDHTVNGRELRVLLRDKGLDESNKERNPNKRYEWKSVAAAIKELGFDDVEGVQEALEESRTKRLETLKENVAKSKAAKAAAADEESDEDDDEDDDEAPPPKKKKKKKAKRS